MQPRRLPPYVQRVGSKFRGWAPNGPKRWWGPLRTTPQDAYQDAVKARGLRHLPAQAGSLGQRAEEWLASVQGSRTPDTVAYYRSKLKVVYRTIPKTMPVARISVPILRAFAAEAQQSGLAARTIQHCRRTLHRLYVWMQRRGYVTENPVPLVDWPRPGETRLDVFTEAELAQALLRVNGFGRDLAVFMAYTGLRRAEVARLRLEDVDVKGGVLWVRGKSRAQSHPLPPEAADAAVRLVAHATSEFLIRGTTDKARRSRIAETFRRWQRTLGEPRWHAHALRHSVGTIMVRHGVSPAVVQRFLRHSSYAMTQRYVHMVEDDVRGATARLKLLGGEAEADHA